MEEGEEQKAEAEAAVVVEKRQARQQGKRIANVSRHFPKRHRMDRQ